MRERTRRDNETTYVRSGPRILLRLEQHDVQLGHEEAAEGHRRRDVDAHAHARYLDLQNRETQNVCGSG